MRTLFWMRVVHGPDTGREAGFTTRLSVGRGDSDVVLSDPRVSRTHLVLAVDDLGGVWVGDAGSSSGTRVNGQPILQPVPLRPGDSVGLGDTELRVLRPVRLEAERSGELIVWHGGVELARHAVGRSLVLGRDESCDVVVRIPSVSRAHLRFHTHAGVVTVEDLGSRSGTLLDGRPLLAPTPLPRDADLELVDTGVAVRFVRAEAASSAHEFRITAEPGGRAWAVTASGTPAPTIGEVATAAAAYLHLGAGPGRWTFARADATLLHPDDDWAAAGIVRGELLTTVASAGVDEAPVTAPPPAWTPVDWAPAPAYTVPRDRIDLPRPPAGTERQAGLVWQIGGGSLGVIAGIVVGAVTSNWLFAVIGGVAGLGAVVFGLAGEASRRASRRRQFREQVTATEQRLAGAAAHQAYVRRGRALHLADARRALAEQALWWRRPGDGDFALPVLGWGARPARLELAGTAAGVDDPDVHVLLTALARPRALDDVPITPTEPGVLGLIGAHRRVTEIAAGIVVEAALAQAPSTLRIAVLACDPGLDWARWLPHTADPAGPLVSIDAGSARALLGRLSALLDAAERRQPLLCVVAPDAAGLAAPLAERWTAAAGTLLLCGARPHDLAGRPHAVLLADEQGGRLEGITEPGTTFTPAVLAPEQAAGLALGLARLVDAGAPRRRTTPPASLLQLLDRDHGVDGGLAERWWRGTASPLAATVGVDDTGASVRLDLETDGPHLVIAGTTGSGKSEAIATLLASLVASHGPERLALFLVDFKGGATMNRFAGVPHVVGVVTDLEEDPHLAMRAFTSLEAELTRRKRILGSAGCADLRGYLAAGSPGGVVPSLVVVIDEFALLVQSQPAVKSRLDVVAAQGRSLGVHLVLATQSPSGVVTAAIRANTNLWLALRVVGDNESREILGQPDAARIPVAMVGRALLRRGGEDTLRAFRVVQVTVPAEAGRTVRLEPYADHRPDGEPGGWEPRGSEPRGSEPRDTAASRRPTVLDGLLDAARDAALRLGSPVPRPLWFPPLPRRLTVDDLPDAETAGPAAGAPTLTVTLGLLDDPAAQRQEPWRIDLAAGNLLVSGGPRSGRTTTLAQVACALAASHPPADVHLYALGATDSLAALDPLPHLGGRALADDRELAGRLLERLARESERRRNGASATPRIVLLLDDLGLVREALEHDPQHRLVELLGGLVQGGRAVGLHVAAAAGAPTELRTALLGAFTHRVQLRTQDRSDYLTVEWRPGPDEVPAAVPGRGVVLGGREVQLVLADPERAAALAAAWPADGAPVRLGRLPTSVDYTELTAEPGQRHPIGIRAPDLDPLLLPDGPGDHLLILGGPGSGRTTALRTIARAAAERAGQRVCGIDLRGSAPWAPATVADTVVDPVADPVTPRVARTVAEAEELLAVAEGGGGAWVLFDDADAVAPQLGDRLDRLLRAARSLDVRVIVAASAAEWTRAHDPWARQLGALRRLLVLPGGREAAAALDVRIPQAEVSNLPGRGHLTTPDGIVAVQVAHSAADAPAS